MNLLTATITTAVAAVVTPIVIPVDISPRTVALQGNFTYGAGGTTAKAWVQTSLDGGVTWCDVAEFSFTTSNARFVYVVNASTSITSELTPTNGTLNSTTANDGLIGPIWRVKYTTTGTYSGGTVLAVDAYFNGAMAAA